MSQPLSDVKIQLFGMPSLLVHGEPVKLRYRKSMALIAYLAATNQPQHRERLTTLLWPEATASVGSSSLRNALADLSANLPPDALDLTRQTITLPPDVFVDIRVFTGYVQHIQQANCQLDHLSTDCLVWMSEITDLYTGDFMAHFNIKGSPEFEDWAFLQSIEYQRHFESVVSTMARHYWRLEHDDVAIELTHRWLETSPHNEHAHQLLMHLFARNNQAPRAVEQYHYLARTLRHVYDREPNEATTTLYDTIRSGNYQMHRPVITWGKPIRSILPHVPRIFGGQDAGLAWIKTRLGLHDEIERSPMLVIVGEPGVGKTALAAQLAYDQAVREVFTDGVLWASLDAASDLQGTLRLWLDALRISELKSTSRIEHLSMQLAAGLFDKRMLLLVDDVKTVQAARLFNMAKTASVVIFTTRLHSVARQIAASPDDVHYLQPLNDDAAFGVLTEIAPQLVQEHANLAKTLIETYSGLPLVLHQLAQIYADCQMAHPKVREKILNDPLKLLDSIVISDQMLDDDMGQRLSDILAAHIAEIPQPVLQQFMAIAAAHHSAHVVQDITRIASNPDLLEQLVEHTLLVPRSDGGYRINQLLAVYLHQKGNL